MSSPTSRWRIQISNAAASLFLLLPQAMHPSAAVGWADVKPAVKSTYQSKKVTFGGSERREALLSRAVWAFDALWAPEPLLPSPAPVSTAAESPHCRMSTPTPLDPVGIHCGPRWEEGASIENALKSLNRGGDADKVRVR